MADEPQVIRGIDWKSTLPFTQIFKSFRVAIHPSKIILALLALLSIYVVGRILDGIWPARHSAVPMELRIYEDTRDSEQPREAFRRQRQAIRADIEAAHAQRLAVVGQPEGSLRDITRHIRQQRDEAVAAANMLVEEGPDTPAAELSRRRAVRHAHEVASARLEEARQIRGEGLFITFYQYQVAQVYTVLHGVVTLNWTGPGSVMQGLVRFFFYGPAWAITHHPVYFIIFGLLFLCIWSIFGGAISRIAAVHVARDEKISIRQALRFSTAKFLSFLSAPIIPLLIVLVVGLIVAIGGLLGNIPYIGPPIIGALFFLALAAGFIMTLVLLGLVGGFNLMYPTIAVEGSDSFDAISRSFSYLYARPWRLAFYTIIALIYGAITYLFVRFFIALLLLLTHLFAGWFIFADAQSGAPLWETMWPMSADRLSYAPLYDQLRWDGDLGAFLIAFWVYLVIGLLGAYAISFYFSANTIIYYLMRNEVDATEMDDVYLEQTEEDFGDATGTGTMPPGTVGVAPAGTTPVETTPAVPPASGVATVVPPVSTEPGTEVRPPGEPITPSQPEMPPPAPPQGSSESPEVGRSPDDREPPPAT
jgi:hypothetical protein